MNTDLHVVIPHYRVLPWLDACLNTHQKRSKNPERIAYTVITMEEDQTLAEEARTLVGSRADVIWHPTHGMWGGQPLPSVLLLGSRLKLSVPYTLLVDPDALMLAQDWDSRLRSLFADQELVVAGINPRSILTQFAGSVEWNWMAFRTQFWADNVGHFDIAVAKCHDIGHIMTQAASQHGKRQHLWGLKSYALDSSRSACVCGDDIHSEWALHAFYSSRRRKDRNISAIELAQMLTPAEEALLIERYKP